MESPRARTMQRIRREIKQMQKQMTPVTNVEVEIRKAAVQPEGQRDEAQPEEWSHEAVDSRRLTKAELEDKEAWWSWWTDRPRWRGGS